jgi:hypothetical protein
MYESQSSKTITVYEACYGVSWKLVAFKAVGQTRCIYIYYTIYRIILINIYKLLCFDCSLNLVRFINFEGILCTA